jgi:2,3-bisphosphoglycerate-independent phosphoglycerate mutase
MDLHLLSSLVVTNQSKVVLAVLDGLGDIAGPEGLTPLEAARTPNLDRLAERGVCGLHIPVAPGITPGSGPAHIGLFGYDPWRNLIGRGVLDTAGTDFVFQPGDLASRINYATLAPDGTVTDRRAGRLDDAEGRRVTEKLARAITRLEGVQVLLQHVKDYRAAAIFRGEKLDARLCDSDPQKTGLKPLQVKPLEQKPTPEALRAARLANLFIEQAARELAGEKKANFVMLRGFDLYQPLEDFCRLYKWRAVAVASYPMYKGVARLCGMRVIDEGQQKLEEEISLLERHFAEGDFFFLHFKKTDSAGEDGNFAAKVSALEEFDAQLPRIEALKPEVLCITGDHSTPCALRSHSWHPVPVCLAAESARRDDCRKFSEREFLHGGLGIIHSTDLLPLLLAHAGRLQKFGA